ncbi:hypothetical protein AALB39_09385 [Lachnospiraceae bacterium 54-53]
MRGSFIYRTGAGGKLFIAEARRVGIDYAGEARDFLWRFYVEGSIYVSVK